MTNIVDILKTDFPTLYSLIAKANLVDTLKNAQALTILAPNDAAFNKIPKETLQAVGNSPEQLKAILLQHVIPSKVESTDIVTLTSAKTLGGQITIAVKNGEVIINNSARVVDADIEADNGVIHEIDTVILP